MSGSYNKNIVEERNEFINKVESGFLHYQGKNKYVIFPKRLIGHELFSGKRFKRMLRKMIKMKIIIIDKNAKDMIFMDNNKSWWF